MTKRITHPSPSSLICMLSSLFTALLFIIIILLLTISGRGIHQTEQMMEVKLRNLSLGVHARLEGLSQQDSSRMQKMAAMESFVKELRQNNVMSKVEEMEIFMKRILSNEVTGSLSHDQQRILAALGDLADEMRKGNSSSDPVCGTDWVHHGSSCYRFYRSIKVWRRAKANCEARSSHLVVINTEEEMTFLGGISESRGMWIGLNQVHFSWQWVDGTPYEKTPMFWKENHNSFDRFYMGDKGCALLLDGDRWNGKDCFSEYPYICEKTTS